MLIKALCDYYNMREQNGENTLPYYCWPQKISHAILLTPDGEISEIRDIRDKETIIQNNDKTKDVFVPKIYHLPWRSQKTAVDLNIVEHRAEYIFGLNYSKGAFSPDKKAKEAHECFAKGNLEFCKDLTSDIAKAYYKFVEKWIPEEQTQNPALLKLGKDYADTNTCFCFALDGHPEIMLHNDKELMTKYHVEFDENAKLQQEELECAMCAIEGEVLPIELTHDRIVGVYGVKNNRGSIVAYNESAFESYGKKQSTNSNISYKAMKKYTYALNRLLEEKNHHMRLGETTIAFFALSKNDSIESGCLQAALDGTPDEKLNDGLKSILAELRRGRAGKTDKLEIDKDDAFYIVGLTPNAARISVKFVVQNTFGKIMDNVIQHQRDLAVKENGNQIAFSRILKELVSPKAKSPTVPTPLSSAILYSIFNGTNYPQQLLATVVRRVKTDSDEEKNKFIKMNDTRVGIIKACLNRKARLSGKEEKFQMTFDFENKSDAYNCGRLFALLEYIQKNSVDAELNKTIKDTYFSSACSRPATVFPKLIFLAQHHMAKLRKNGKNDKSREVGEIISQLKNGFPTTTTVEEQGEYIIGYYSQNAYLYTSRKKETDATEADTTTDITTNE